jgi:short-subunit dehydrogenase
MNISKVWYVTGASQGLGLSLVKTLLDKGYRVAVTSRDARKLSQAIGLIDKQRFLPLAVDLNNPDCIDESIKQTLETFGQIDVLVNNAGYGMAGIVEETPEQEIAKIFSVNVLAAIEVVKRVVPIMREQSSGHIINIGSVAGFSGAAGWAIYSATKAAIAAFSEVMALDLKEYGIHVTVVEPSGFRTGFLNRDSLAYSESKLEGYRAVKATQEQYLATDGKQAGDPVKASAILIQMAESPTPPIHLYLGQNAYDRASEKLKIMTSELEEGKAITISADFAPDH